jgi:hypothetical protein
MQTCAELLVFALAHKQIKLLEVNSNAGLVDFEQHCILKVDKEKEKLFCFIPKHLNLGPGLGLAAKLALVAVLLWSVCSTATLWQSLEQRACCTNVHSHLSSLQRKARHCT